MNENDAVKNLKNLLASQSMSKVEHLKKGLFLLKPSKVKTIILLVIYALLLYASYNIVKSNNTEAITKDIITNSSAVILGVFAIVFTGYALFQALINITALKVLLSNKGKKFSLIEEYNLYFLEVGTIYILIICLNYILGIVVSSNILEKINILNLNITIIGTLAIGTYCIIIIYAISEILSFLFNLYKCFNISSAAAFIENQNKPN